jgi:hypothetical protein
MGAAGKYGQIQDEQRQFQASQTKAQADDLRRRRYAEFDYELKDSYAGSGQMEGGVELTKRELKGRPEGTALESKTAFAERKRAEAEQKQLDKTLAAEERSKERQVEAEGRSEERQVEGEKRRAKLSEESQARTEEARVKAAEAKAELDAIKNDKKFSDTFNTKIASLASKAGDDPIDQHMAKAPLVESIGSDERLKGNKAIKQFLRVEKIADMILQKKGEDLNRKETEAFLKKGGATSREIKTAMGVLEVEGNDLSKGWGW